LGGEKDDSVHIEEGRSWPKGRDWIFLPNSGEERGKGGSTFCQEKGESLKGEVSLFQKRGKGFKFRKGGGGGGGVKFGEMS